MRAITYARVSTDEQTDSRAGLDAQQTALSGALARPKWTLVESYIDEGRSGGNMNRPALSDALARLDRGEADVLVCAKLDRLSRSVLDFAAICARAKRKGWAAAALDVDVDTTTPTGELLVNITTSVAQWERRIIGVRTKRCKR